MKNCLFFPTGFEGVNAYNDNIDINVGLISDGNSVDLYVATLFTKENVSAFIEKGGYFWASDMIIIERLEIPLIKKVIGDLILNEEKEAMTFVKKYKNEIKFKEDLGSFMLIEF